MTAREILVFFDFFFGSILDNFFCLKVLWLSFFLSNCGDIVNIQKKRKEESGRKLNLFVDARYHINIFFLAPFRDLASCKRARFTYRGCTSFYVYFFSGFFRDPATSRHCPQQIRPDFVLLICYCRVG